VKSEPTDLPASTADDDSRGVARLLPLVYDELRRLASAWMMTARRRAALTPTELVHEAYLRVTGCQAAGFEGRRHFFFAASRAMRDIMVENARRVASRKRGGDLVRVELKEVETAPQAPPEDFLDLHRALAKLQRESPDHARVVLLSCFDGRTHPEIAEMMGLSVATVERRWSDARAWLRRELSRSPRRSA